METAEVVVSVGTDHHPFDRLISWMDDWQEVHRDVSVIVQRGTSVRSRLGDSRELIPHADLCGLFARASAVITHGGPSTVMDARMAGRLPIVVARDPDFGEHVDGHQMRFARHLRRHRTAVVVDNADDLFSAINRALNDPSAFSVNVDTQAAEGVVGFGSVVNDLIRPPIAAVSQSPTTGR